MNDPLLDSTSRLFNAFVVGIAACNDTLFLRAYASPGARQAWWSHAGSMADQESNRSGGSKTVPEGCTVVPLGALQGLQKEIERLSLKAAKKSSALGGPPCARVDAAPFLGQERERPSQPPTERERQVTLRSLSPPVRDKATIKALREAQLLPFPDSVEHAR